PPRAEVHVQGRLGIAKMAKLIVNPTSSSRREIHLARTLVSIGRDPSNDLVLPDAMVSRRHAVIEYRGSQYYLRDCNSSNGSLVNGDRVSERNLRDGDLVAIGTARLLFRDDLHDEEAGAKVVQHPSAEKAQALALAPALAPAIVPRERPMRVPRPALVEPWPTEDTHDRSTPPTALASFSRRLGGGALDLLAVAAGLGALVTPVILYWRSRDLWPTPADVPFLPIVLSLTLAPVALALGAFYFI